MKINKTEELLMAMSISFDEFCDQYKKSRQGKVTKRCLTTELEQERMNFALRLDDDVEKTWEGHLFNIWASQFIINKDG